WWSEEIDGSTYELGAEFKFHSKDLHRSTQKITELVPGKKVVWQVLDSHINFVKDKSEWKGTDIVFEITKKDDKTELRFTHVGLVPAFECYGNCSDAWGFYINDSLRSLITTGKGQPNQKEKGDKDDKSYYLYKIHPTRLDMLTEGPTSAEAEVISQHFDYLKGLTEQGTAIFVGRTLTTDERTFGITVFQADSEEIAKEIMKNDPAVIAGVMRAELFPFRIVLMGKTPPLDTN
ncbi:MAG TPA: YciI family protein, partial [Anaerolineae bacterium]|nr:YciI family protein [Anaerolineae bacterium]